MACRGRALIAMLVVLGLLHNAAATTYTVGDQNGSNSGWESLTSGQTSYDDQFQNISLVVGDSLSFVFTTGEHDVVEIPPADVAGCDSSNPISIIYNSSIVINLTTAGQHGFMCTIADHCTSEGMHLLVNVSAATAPAPAPGAQSPAPGTSLSPTPAPATSVSPAPAPATSRSPTPAPAPATSRSPAPSPSSPAPGGGNTSPTAAPGPGNGNGSSGSFKFQSKPVILLGSLLAACAVLVV